MPERARGGRPGANPPPPESAIPPPPADAASTSPSSGAEDPTASPGGTVAQRARPGQPVTGATPAKSAETSKQEIESMTRELIQGPVRDPIRVFFADSDGTLTDGVIGHTRDTDYRNFWVRDGLALQWARDLGVLPVVISGRSSAAVVERMKDLGIEYHEGVKDKVAVAQQVLDRVGASWGECVMIGDDLPDYLLMKQVGWSIAVGNAQPEIKLLAKTVLGTHGGRGAVREAVEMVLKHNGTWDQVLERYGAR